MIKKPLATLACSLAAAAAYAGTTPMQPQPQQEYVQPSLISYSNVSLSYMYSSADALGFDVDGHGAAVGLEISPIDHLYFALNGSWTDIDIFGVDIDYWRGQAGVGAYVPLADNIHFVTEFGASYADISLADFDDVGTDDWGVYARPHLRMKFGAFETHVGVTYDSNELVPSEWTAFARLLFEVAPNLDVFVGVNRGFESNEVFEDVWGAQAGVRFKF